MQFVAINATTAVTQANELLQKCTFPVLQDTDEVKAWELMAGIKDDFYIYGSDGLLAIHLPSGGAVSTNLSTSEGYANVHDLLLVVE